LQHRPELLRTFGRLKILFATVPFFVQKHYLLTRAAAAVRDEHLAKQANDDLPLAEKKETTSATERTVTVRRQHLFNSIKELQRGGKTIRGIARQLKIARNTVRRYIDCETVPRNHPGAGRQSSVRPFADYLQQRWKEGERNGSQLWMEIKARGFVGEIDAVQRFIREWRKTSVGKAPCAISVRGLSPRQAAKLLLNPESAKNETEQMYLAHLRKHSPEVSAIERLGIGFQQLVKERRGDLFDEWLKQVRASGVHEVENWADGLLADETAVRNALSLHWSNGQVEGQVNRLKTIKRQMYGRAKFDLLRARVLYQA
jgi:transposase